jgi:hypothetical protein
MAVGPPPEINETVAGGQIEEFIGAGIGFSLAVPIKSRLPVFMSPMRRSGIRHAEPRRPASREKGSLALPLGKLAASSSQRGKRDSIMTPADGRGVTDET